MNTTSTSDMSGISINVIGNVVARNINSSSFVRIRSLANSDISGKYIKGKLSGVFVVSNDNIFRTTIYMIPILATEEELGVILKDLVQTPVSIQVNNMEPVIQPRLIDVIPKRNRLSKLKIRTIPDLNGLASYRIRLSFLLKGQLSDSRQQMYLVYRTSPNRTMNASEIDMRLAADLLAERENNKTGNDGEEGKGKEPMGAGGQEGSSSNNSGMSRSTRATILENLVGGFAMNGYLKGLSW